MPVVFSGWKTYCDKAKQLQPGQAPKTSHDYTMYHGTLKSNASAIISSGFKPSSGGTLGPGVYCSRDIKKAMSYPAFCAPDDRVVFKLRVRVGKVKRIDSQCLHLQTTWHQNGYDTAWLPGSALNYEEDCVWDPKRVTVVGIAHCTDSSTKSSLEGLIKQHGGGKGPGRSERAGNQCKTCGIQTKQPHAEGKCWTCKANICYFMEKHVCPMK
ncbi:gig2-like protein DreN [Trichomycterus rosablanca]|uniref:gig2-like protein DreN n=1 Tax=Trichomycterus rosablanca TaxID=2290929 RepID=UPI002F358B2B